MPNPIVRKSNWGVYPFALVVGLTTLIIYILTLFPTVPPGDSGELIVQAYHLGVAHPPGYPLYLMLAKLFTLIPVGSVAWRVNLFSAVCGAGASTLLFLGVSRASKSVASGILTAGLFSFSSIVWRHAVGAEVFALNNLFVSALLYVSYLYSEEQEIRFLILCFFAMGLGLTNHQTIVFYEIPLSLWFVILAPKRFFRNIHWVALAFLVGLSPYVYLWISGHRHVPGSWGETGTWSGFLTHVLRREYGTFQLEAGNGAPIGLTTFLSSYFWTLLKESLWICPVFSVLGFVFGGRGSKGWCAIWGSAVGIYLIVFHSLANIAPNEGVPLAILSRFWQQANLVFFVGAGLGVGVLENWLRERPSFFRWALGFASLSLVVVQIVLNFNACDNHNNRTFSNLGHALLDPLPKNSLIFFVGNEMSGSSLYLQQCEGVRPDVRIADLYLLQASWYKNYVQQVLPDVSIPGTIYLPGFSNGYDLKQLLDANIGRHPIFMNYFPPDSAMARDMSLDDSYTIWPYGFLNVVISKSTNFDPTEHLMRTDQVYAHFNGGEATKFNDRPWEGHLLSYLRETKFQRSLAFIQRGMQNVSDPSLLRVGITSLESLIDSDSHPEPGWYQLLRMASARVK